MNLIKKTIGLILFIYLFVFFNPMAMADLPFTVQHFETPEGLSVDFVHEDSIPIVVMELGFHAGSGYDRSNPGLANLVAHSLGEATSHQNGNQIAESLDATGAELSVNVDPDLTVLTMHSQSDPIDLNAAVGALVPVVSDLNISQDILNREQQSQIQALEISHSQPDQLARQTLMQILFAGTPYEFSILGKEDSVSAITTQNVMDFYHQYYQDQNGVFVIVGNIDLVTAKAVAESFSQAFPSGQLAPALVVKPNPPAMQKVHVYFPSKQTTILIGQVAMAKKNPLNLGLLAGSIILGGPTLKSLLFDSTRQQGLEGLTYLASSSLDTYGGAGVFSILAQTQSDAANAVQNQVETIFQNLVTQGPADNNLSNARSFLVGNLILKYSSDQSLADLLLMLKAYGYPENYLDQISQNLLLLTPTDVTNALQKLTQNGPQVIVTVGGDKSQ